MSHWRRQRPLWQGPQERARRPSAGRSARTALPPRLDVRLARAVHRYGWYVDRGAFGTDLHAASRRALLRRASGGTISAQTHLELAWAAARQALADDAAASDLQAAEAMVTGSLPLPAEHGQPDGAPGGQRGGDIRFPPDGTVVPDTPRPCVHVRPGFVLRPVAATWDFTVFAASGPARRAYACIPRDSLPGFAAALEEGTLDDAIAAYLALSHRRRSCQRLSRRHARAFTTGWAPPPSCSLPSVTPRPATRSQGSQGRSVRWHARANGTDRIGRLLKRNRKLPKRIGRLPGGNRGLPGRQPGPSRERQPSASQSPSCWPPAAWPLACSYTSPARPQLLCPFSPPPCPFPPSRSTQASRNPSPWRTTAGRRSW